MSKPLYVIGELLDSVEDMTPVKVQDVHISPTSGQIIYECITLGERPTYPLYREADLQEYEVPY